MDLKAFRPRQKPHRPLSFASAEDLWDKLGLTPGLSPLWGCWEGKGGRWNSSWIRRSWPRRGSSGVHPNDNTASLWLRTEDLIALLRDHGTAVRVVPV